MPTNRSFRTLRSIFALMLREMSTTYGRSPGGYLWVVLEPVLGILFLSVIFSLTFRHPALGTNFPLFYATGILPFIVYRDLSLKVAHSLRFSRQLLFYPAIIFLDAIIARFLLNFIVHILVFYILITSISLAFGLRATIEYPFIVTSFLLAGLLGLGVGCLNCFLISVFPVWEHVWTVLNRPMLILSSVLFVFEDIPEPYASFLWYNPLVHVVGLMREAFYPSYDGHYISVVYVILIGLVCLILGLLFLNRYHRDILNK